MRYCVDAICGYKGKLVLIHRLSFPFGLALPGGGIEEGESKEDAVIREIKEETGLDFIITEWMPRAYDTEGRDPRGPATSYVAVGYGTGNLKDEKGKTRIILMETVEFDLTPKMDFAFDHHTIIEDYAKMSYLRSFTSI